MPIPFKARIDLATEIQRLLLASPETGAQWAHICLLEARLIEMGDVSAGPGRPSAVTVGG